MTALMQLDVLAVFTQSDGIKHPLAVQRQTWGPELCELPLLQRSVQNLTRQPHQAVPQRFT